VLADGARDSLGLGIEKTEGVKFGLRVFNNLMTRGVHDILVAVADGLKRMPEAIGAAFPAPTLQTCIVHLIRNILHFASREEHKAPAAGLGPV
jgi:putative transposase